MVWGASGEIDLLVRIAVASPDDMINVTRVVAI